MAMSIYVRQATPGDMAAFLSLVEALAHYEHLSPPDAGGRERLQADALAGRFRLLLGELDGVVVGYAAWFPTYSTFLARPTLYLEDLFVLPRARGRRVGAALFQACAAQAVGMGCGRLEWSVLAWNQLAIRFYEARGASQLQEWLPYRLEGEQLRSVAEGAPSAAT